MTEEKHYKELYDLSHLTSRVVRTMTLDLRAGKQKHNVRLEFRFSCHCYSRKPKAGETIPTHLFIPEGPRSNPRDRIFCEKRYLLSLDLLTLIDDLILNNKEVDRSRNHNIFSTHLVMFNEDGTSTEIEYYIFMDVNKKQDPSQPPKLEIFIESAYPQDDNVPNPASHGRPLKLSVVLGNVWENRKP